MTNLTEKIEEILRHTINVRAPYAKQLVLALTQLIATHEPNNDADANCRITAAAIKHDGMICYVEKPGRHHDVIRAMATAGVPISITSEQGFITNEGIFVGRKLAKLIASRAGQIINLRNHHDELFSEDLW